MKIALDAVIFQLQRSRPRGVSRVWSEAFPYMWKMLESQGHEIVVLCREQAPEPGDPYKLPTSFQNLIRSGMKTHAIPSCSSRFFHMDYPMLSSICTALDVNLFISTYHTVVTSPRIKILGMVHDLIPEIRHYQRLQPRSTRTMMYNKANALICVSENTKRVFSDWYPKISPKKLHVAHLATSDNFYPQPQEAIDEFKKQHQIDNYFIIDGELTPEQSIRFCKICSQIKPDINLLSYGGPIQEYVEKDCINYGLNLHRIKWLSDADVPIALSGSEGLIFPSQNEGFGLPVLEAMACKAPVLCSNVDSLPEVGADCVRYFKSDEAVSWKKGLQKFFANKDDLVEKAYSRSKKFSWKKTARKIVDVIERM